MNQQSPLAAMLPFDSIGLYEQPKARFSFKVPRVVSDQKAKFDGDELFKKLSRESEVRYTGYRDRPLSERQIKFQNGCREGHTEIAFVSNGTNLQLYFPPSSNAYPHSALSECDFQKDPGKVHVRSRFIMNGVCVRWKGWIDLERLDGVGGLEFDEETAEIENDILKKQVQTYNHHLREIEERQKGFRSSNGSLSAW